MCFGGIESQWIPRHTYTGGGYAGFYKLLMTFDETMQLETKIKLAERQKPVAAAIVDHPIDYFFGKITELSQS